MMEKGRVKSIERIESEDSGSENNEELGEISINETSDSRLPALDLNWLIGCGVITAIAAFLRFYLLALKPLHHDEGVNGHFLTKLFRDGVYQYDPSNYHGPDLYYISLAFSKIFGLNTWSIRSSVAIFGLLTVILVFFLRRYIGKIGSLAAGLFLALSPGMVFISRYFIHEILFVFFSLSFVVTILYFIEKRKAGYFATAWMTLLLMVCFLPPALSFAATFGKQNIYLLWGLRIFVLIIEAGLVFYVVRMLLAWEGGRPIYLMLASASLIFLFATKETAFITVGTMLIACVSVKIWEKITGSDSYINHKFTILALAQGVVLIGAAVAANKYFTEIKEFGRWFYAAFTGEGVPNQVFIFYSIILLGIISVITYFLFFILTRNEKNTSANGHGSEFIEPNWRKFREGLGSGADFALIIVAAATVFIYVGVLFFSSFFTYPDGVRGFFEAYVVWTKTGSKDHTQNGWIAYVRWLLQIESPLIFLSLIGTLIALVKAEHRFAMFTGLWAYGLFLAYTIIPYKTPWLALSFTLPMCIIAGYGINELVRSNEIIQKVFAVFLTAISVFILSYQTYDQNFLRYDNDRMPYVYAHTERGFLDLIGEINRYAEKSGQGKNASIEIVSPDYWSMPWYLNDYPKANFHGQFVDANTSEMIVASKAQLSELAPRYAAHYKYAGTYPLRPGVKLYLLVRKDLADSNALDIYQISNVE